MCFPQAHLNIIWCIKQVDFLRENIVDFREKNYLREKTKLREKIEATGKQIVGPEKETKLRGKNEATGQ
jgi:hypothetical protein